MASLNPTKMGSGVKDIAGQQFGRLTVMEFRGLSKHRTAMWRCVCACGEEVVVVRGSLVKGLTKSCGCLNREQAAKQCVKNRLTHGHTRNRKPTPEYRCWEAMIQRCTNPNATAFKYYGARGIYVCDRWRKSFETFLQDMGHRPSPNLSIDRIDTDGPYSQSNCRWATFSQQMKNRRKFKRGKGHAPSSS